jgi:penicillin-binding protein 2
MFGDEELIKLHKARASQVANIILFCFGIVIARLWFLQIYKGELYHKYSLQNRLRKETLRAPRGMIFSRNDQLLVDNIPRLDAILTRQYLSNKEDTLKRLSDILSMEVGEIEKIIRKNAFEAKYRPIIIKKNISLDEVARIETENAFLPGVSVDTFISREYNDKDIGAHVLGYISEINQDQLPRYRKRDGIDYRLGDFIGQFGIEERMDKMLRGSNGYEYVEVDALGRKKKYIGKDNLFQGIDEQEPAPGKNLRLTIDRDMQRAGFKALEDKTGSVVALDVHTGEVLAMISRPAFDPSQFSRGLSTEYWNSLINNPENPLRARNVQEHFPPGSTFKPFTAIAALEEGIINKNTKLRCHGSFRYGRRTYHSWRWGTEKVKIDDALKQSCNVFFYKVAADIDIDVLAKYAKMFGFGKRTGIALPREVSGLFPTKEWKQKQYGKPWQQGETLSCSIGQSYVLVSTLQLAQSYAALATKGKIYRPQVVKEVFDNKGNIIKKFQPELVSEIKLKDESHWDIVRRGLYKVVNDPEGTAWWRRGLGNQMAGKTGTSQVVRAASVDQLYAKCNEKEREFRHHGVFVAFAPYHDPKIAVAALVEHGCSGSKAAAPVVEKVVNTYMKKYMPDTYKKYAQEEKEQFQKWYAKFRAKRAQAKKEQESEDEGD